MANCARSVRFARRNPFYAPHATEYAPARRAPLDELCRPAAGANVSSSSTAALRRRMRRGGERRGQRARRLHISGRGCAPGVEELPTPARRAGEARQKLPGQSWWVRSGSGAAEPGLP
eukprot:2378678-Prymnesium_polylepis.1